MNDYWVSFQILCNVIAGMFRMVFVVPITWVVVAVMLYVAFVIMSKKQ